MTFFQPLRGESFSPVLDCLGLEETTPSEDASTSANSRRWASMERIWTFSLTGRQTHCQEEGMQHEPVCHYQDCSENAELSDRPNIDQKPNNPKEQQIGQRSDDYASSDFTEGKANPSRNGISEWD